MQGLGIRAQGLALMLLLGGAACAQDIQLGERRVAGKEHVALLSDSVEVRGGHEQVVELRFRVDPGFHINSHVPKDELLIPTVLTLESGGRTGVDVQKVEYPAGAAFRLPVGAGETLDVFQGEFRVTVRMIADVGQSNLVGKLRYQACDNSACFPPRTLAVKIAVTGK